MNASQNPYDYLFPKLPEPELKAGRAALVIIDLQYFDADRDFGWGRRLREQGVGHLAELFFQRLEKVVIPNVQLLQAACRSAGVEVVFVKIEMQKPDLGDAGRLYRLLGFDCPRGSHEAEILAAVAPAAGEIVISKTSTGAFNSSVLDQTLRNLGIDVLLVVGVNTDSCVELTSRDAADRGYSVIVVDDACGCLSGESNHELALRRMSQVTITVKTTSELLAQIDARAGAAKRA